MGIESFPYGAAAPSRLITKQNAAGQSLTLTSATVPNGGTSSWVTASSTLAADVLVTGVGFYVATLVGNSSHTAVSIDIGYGASGSEVAVSSLFCFSGNTSANWVPGGWADLAVPQRIAAGQQVSVRARALTSWGGPYSVSFAVATMPYANLE